MSEDGSRFCEPVRVPGVPGVFERAYVLQKIKGETKTSKAHKMNLTAVTSLDVSETMSDNGKRLCGFDCVDIQHLYFFLQNCTCCGKLCANICKYIDLFFLILFRWRENSKLYWGDFERNLITESYWHWENLAQLASINQNISSLDWSRQDDWSEVCTITFLFFTNCRFLFIYLFIADYPLQMTFIVVCLCLKRCLMCTRVAVISRF